MNVYIVAIECGNHYYIPTTRKTFKTEKAVLKEHDRLKEAGHEDLIILKAQWIEADFVEYEKLKENEK